MMADECNAALSFDRGEVTHGELVDRPGFDLHGSRYESMLVIIATGRQTGRNLRGVSYQSRIKARRGDADGGESELIRHTVMKRKRHHPGRHVKQQVAQEHEQLAEQPAVE